MGAGLVQLAVDVVVRLVRIVVEEVQALHIGAHRQVGDFADAGMAPVDLRRVFMVAVGGVGDQHVRAAHEVGEPLQVALVAPRVGRQVELVVRDVAGGPTVAGDLVAQAGPRVLEQQGLDLHGAEIQRLLAQVAEDEVRAELADRHRKIHAFHLRGDRARDGQVALVGAIDLHLVAADVERREKRHRVDMVPVRMRDEDLRGKPLRARGHDLVGELLDPRAAVKDIQRLASHLDAHAGGIPAALQRAGSGHRQRAAHAPVGDDHVFGHELVDRGEQSGRVDRLHDVAVGTQLARPAAVEIVGLGRQHDDLHRLDLGSAAQLAAQLEAIHHRHHQVGDHAVGTHPGDFLQRLLAGVARNDRVPGFFEHAAQQRKDVGIVVDDVELHFLVPESGSAGRPPPLEGFMEQE